MTETASNTKNNKQNGGTLQKYMDELAKMTNAVIKSHEYTVTVAYNEAGLVNQITITY